jgi:hypothetical protein
MLKLHNLTADTTQHPSCSSFLKGDQIQALSSALLATSEAMSVFACGLRQCGSIRSQ